MRTLSKQLLLRTELFLSTLFIESGRLFSTLLGKWTVLSTLIGKWTVFLQFAQKAHRFLHYVQEVSVFLFEKKIADKLHKPGRREKVSEILRKDVTRLQRLRHSKILRVFHGLEESKWVKTNVRV